MELESRKSCGAISEQRDEQECSVIWKVELKGCLLSSWGI